MVKIITIVVLLFILLYVARMFYELTILDGHMRRTLLSLEDKMGGNKPGRRGKIGTGRVQQEKKHTQAN